MDTAREWTTALAKVSVKGRLLFDGGLLIDSVSVESLRREMGQGNRLVEGWEISSKVYVPRRTPLKSVSVHQ